MKRMCLDLLTEVRTGDMVLVCDGVALSKVDEGNKVEENDVSGNSG
jgi:hydrogenase maturation factor